MGRKQTKETREKISKALKGRLVGNAIYTKGKRIVPLETRKCKNPNCSKEFKCDRWRRKKYCNSKCASYNNGGLRANCGKKGSWYFCKYTNKDVYLDSTWEVEYAQWLDTNDVKWKRPSYFLWQDEFGKERKYYPDFYLIEENKYIDIKNDHLIKKHSHKIKNVIEAHSIDLEVIDRKKLDKILADVVQ
jgi:hypothetical protein